FRDEIRPRFGVVRACEFIMKDAYSFDRDKSGLDRSYRAMHAAYKRIFKRCGLKILIVEADPGVMGGSLSHEFMVPGLSGEDLVLVCPRCKKAKSYQDKNEDVQLLCTDCHVKLEKVNCIEVGHIFQLGEKYSSVLGANFVDADGKAKPMVMGCYGIGISRLMAAIIEQNHDEAGIIWPKEVSPYQVIILPLDVTNRKIKKSGLEIYRRLKEDGLEVLFDDRDERAGVKFNDADLLGISLQIIIGKDFLDRGTMELKIRRKHKKIAARPQTIIREVSRFVYG
ncbi:MAG: His/Gly/Thr/Pro-type tRNA ligase C-terminal domain-containing protein, partial [Candidatus Omnitrophica bacterium]|nr:His/Gly/Thr/Pro-type tRNA ligase C-terminal domain-containing protein [Candidatus Omnitrophota bacterium]